MQIIKQILDKKYESWIMGKKNGVYKFYDFFQAVSLASAFNKLNQRKYLKENEIKYRSMLWKAYSFQILNSVKNSTNENRFEMKEQWINAVKNRFQIISETYRNEILRIVNQDEEIILDFQKFFKGIKKEKVKEPMKFKDLNQDYIIGSVIKERGW